MLILSFISMGLEFLSINHTSIYDKSELIDQIMYYKQMYTRPLNLNS